MGAPGLALITMQGKCVCVPVCIWGCARRTEQASRYSITWHTAFAAAERSYSKVSQ